MNATKCFTHSPWFQAVASLAGLLCHCDDEQIVNWQENADRNALWIKKQRALHCLLSLTQSLTQEDYGLTRVYYNRCIKTNLWGLSNRAFNK